MTRRRTRSTFAPTLENLPRRDLPSIFAPTPTIIYDRSLPTMDIMPVEAEEYPHSEIEVITA